jgi:hypothetical protein
MSFMEQPHNRQRSIALLWAAMCLAGLAIFFVSFLADLDYSDNAIDILKTAGIMLAILPAYQAIGYLQRARLFDRILADEQPIVRWSYGTEQWADFIATEFSSRAGEWKTGVIITTVAGIAIGGLCLAAGAPAFATSSIALGAVALVAALGWSVPRIATRPYRVNPPETIITSDGVIVGGKLFAPTILGQRLKDVKLMTEDGECLLLRFSRTNRAFSQWIAVRVPIPPGAMPEAKEVARQFSPDTKRR